MLKCALVTIAMLTALVKSNAQIYFQNPSFEDDSTWCNCTPIGWTYCYNIGSVILEPQLNNSYVVTELSATNGLYFTAVQTLDSIVFWSNGQMSLSQQLDCQLKQGLLYSFTLDAAAGVTNYPNTSTNFQGNGILQIIGANDTCSDTEVLFESGMLDTTWTSLTAVFTPSVDYTFIRLKAKQPYGENYVIFIDNLSPIHCLNYNQVQATIDDTLVTPGSGIILNAIALGDFDSVYWKTADGDLLTNDLDGGVVNPIASTHYVVATRSTDCGNFWSYDTVNVEIPNSVSVTKPFEFSVSPTLIGASQPIQIASNQNCSFEMFDVNGKSVKRLNIQARTTDFTLDETKQGMYFYRAVSHQGTVVGKMVLN